MQQNGKWLVKGLRTPGLYVMLLQSLKLHCGRLTLKLLIMTMLWLTVVSLCASGYRLH